MSNDNSEFKITGDAQFLPIAQATPFHVCFQCGAKLTLNPDGSATFEGNADAAAQQFFDNVIKQHSAYKKPELERTESKGPEDAELSKIIEELRDAPTPGYNEAVFDHEAILALLVELQERREAEGRIIYQLFDAGWYDTDKSTYDTVTSAGMKGRVLYTVPTPVGFVNEAGTECECVCPACKHEFSVKFEY